MYPWHPWSGFRVGIHEAVKRPGGVVFRCDLKASESERWLEIPAWMFDRSACAGVRLEAKPHTDLAALAGLAARWMYEPVEITERILVVETQTRSV